jgi:hypothetical protein
MTRPELIRASRAALVQVGLGNHSRGSFICEISAEVIGSENPTYAQLQPTVLDRPAEVWKRAYALVYQFLAEHDMAITMRTCTLESAEPTQPTLESYHSTADGQLEELLQAAPEEMPLALRLRSRKTKRPKRVNRPALADRHKIRVKQQNPSLRLGDIARLDLPDSPVKDAAPPPPAEAPEQPQKKKSSAAARSVKRKSSAKAATATEKTPPTHKKTPSVQQIQTDSESSDFGVDELSVRKGK